MIELTGFHDDVKYHVTPADVAMISTSTNGKGEAIGTVLWVKPQWVIYVKEETNWVREQIELFTL